MAPTVTVQDYRQRLLLNLDSTWLTRIVWITSFAVLTALLAQVRVYAPWNPWVPYTGQVLGVVLSGIVLGPRMGAMSMGLYLCLGAVGLPVFADASGGIAVLLGPTAGYLFGFLVASYVAGLLSRRWISSERPLPVARSVPWILAGLAVASLVGVVTLSGTGALTDQGIGQTLLVTYLAVALTSGALWFWSRRETQAFLGRLAVGLVALVFIYVPGIVMLHLSTGLSITDAWTLGAAHFIPVDLAKLFIAAAVTGAVLPPVALNGTARRDRCGGP